MVDPLRQELAERAGQLAVRIEALTDDLQRHTTSPEETAERLALEITKLAELTALWAASLREEADRPRDTPGDE